MTAFSNIHSNGQLSNRYLNNKTNINLEEVSKIPTKPRHKILPLEKQKLFWEKCNKNKDE